MIAYKGICDEEPLACKISDDGPIVYTQPVYTQPMIVEGSTTSVPKLDTPTFTDATANYYIVKQSDGTWVIEENPLMSSLTGLENYKVPTMPAPTASRPWTLDEWLEWNLLEHNGTAYPDNIFSKNYGYEPFLLML